MYLFVIMAITVACSLTASDDVQCNLTVLNELGIKLKECDDNYDGMLKFIIIIII